MEEDNKLKEISVIIAGQWSAQTFNPNFVLKEIFDLPSGEEAELGIDNSNFTLVTKYKNVSLIPTDQFVEIKISDNVDEESAKFATNAVLNILKIFPYIPKLALGINIRFGIAKSLLNSYAEKTLEGFDFSQVTISKDMDNCKQNVIIDNAYTLFNFHYKDSRLFTPNCILNNSKEATTLWSTF